MATSEKKTGTTKKASTQSTLPDTKDLETQFPLSEKDEVKNAEKRMSKAAKKK